MEFSKADLIWNRACENDNLQAAAGDQALSAMVHLHGYIMNGGVLNAIEITEEVELAEAIAGYEFFGLGAVGTLFLQARELIASGARLGRHESLVDREYIRIIPDDSHLSAAFERRLLAALDDFSPI